MERRTRNRSHCRNGEPGIVRDLDKVLADRERQAWLAYAQRERALPLPPPDSGLDSFLDRCILPKLAQIGFDEQFARTLFSLATGAWKPLAAVPDNVVCLHSRMRTDLEEIRQGLLVQAEKKMAANGAHPFLTPQSTYDIVAQAMDPANLHQMLDAVTTPWIILPRACNSLKQDQAHYLPAYLEMIERETNDEALHTFTRILIEFLANFTIRFADRLHSKDAVIRLVIAGYDAMYWKLLRSPPRGFEDVRLFEHFLTWMKHSDCHLDRSDSELAAIIETMVQHKSQVFPYRAKSQDGENGYPNPSSFLVALRHGCLGIASSVRYFTNRPEGLFVPFDQGMAWGTTLFDLKSLFDHLAHRYDAESTRTQYFIRDFIFQLQNAFGFMIAEAERDASAPRTRDRFVQVKITAMIQKLQFTQAAPMDN